MDALVVQFNIGVYGDVAPVAPILWKAVNDETANASLSDAEGDAVEFCGLVQILSVDRADKCTCLQGGGGGGLSFLESTGMNHSTNVLEVIYQNEMLTPHPLLDRELVRSFFKSWSIVINILR